MMQYNVDTFSYNWQSEMNLGDRIRKLMDEREWSEGELARQSGVNQPTIHRILVGTSRDPRASNLDKIAGALGTSAEFLRHGKPGDDVDSRGVSSIPIRKVPIISSVQAGAWTAAYSHEYLDDQAEYQVTTLNVSDTAFALRVQGDSMSNPYSTPSIPEGSIVIVEPHPDPDSGKIVVAMLDGSDEATIKKLQIDGPNRFLVPLNPKYPTMAINGNCRIVGYVKQVIQNL